MAKFNLVEHYKNITLNLQSQYKLSSAYGHSGTKGNLRETILIDTIKSMAPDYINVCKGEICDSTGSRSPEFDIIISYNSNAMKLFSSSGNNVIPIESVLAVIEVKSTLAEDHLTKFNNDLSILNKFNRYYEPSGIYQRIIDQTKDNLSNKYKERAIKANETFEGVTKIIGGVFSFESPAGGTAKEWTKSVNFENNFSFIFSLSRFLIVLDHVGNNHSLYEHGENSFFLFSTLLNEVFNTNEREIMLKANSIKYIEYAAANKPQ
jgi:hypothetical protein